MKCAVYNCKVHNFSRASEISFFSFPTDKALLQKWIDFCQRTDSQFNPATASICMHHFSYEDIENNIKYEMGFTKKRILKKGAVPTIKAAGQEFSMADKESVNKFESLSNKEYEKNREEYQESAEVATKSTNGQKNAIEYENALMEEQEEHFMMEYMEAVEEEYDEKFKINNQHVHETEAPKLSERDNESEVDDIEYDMEYEYAETDEDAKEDLPVQNEYSIKIRRSKGTAQEDEDSEDSEGYIVEIDDSVYVNESELTPIINEKLIKAVQEHEILWHNKYQQKFIKEKQLMWKDIAKNLNSSAFLCKKRWKYLRDAFLKQQKGVESKGKLYEHLKFLENNLRIVRRRRCKDSDQNTCIDELKLINEVKKYPALYDLDCADNKNKIKIEKIWKGIGKRLSVDSYFCKKTWVNLRTNYRLKKDRVLTFAQWEFTEHMQFLDNHRSFMSYGKQGNSSDEEWQRKHNLLPLSSLKLIMQVKKYNLLYNPALKDFENDTKKDYAWCQIAEALKSDVLSCKQRWHNLCTIFKKYKLKPNALLLFSADNGKTTFYTWQYISSMGFLDKYFQDVQMIEEQDEDNQNSYTNFEEDDDTIDFDDVSAANVPIEKLIDEVRLYPILYNTKDPGFNDNAKKTVIWKEIGAKLAARAQVCKYLWENIYNSYQIPTNNMLDETTGEWTSTTTKYGTYLQFLDEYLGIGSASIKLDDALLDFMKTKIIEEISKVPILYNRDYNNKCKQRLKEWERISRELNTDVATVKSFWRNLIYEFKIYKARKMENPSAEWRYAHMMEFVDDIIVPKTQYTSGKFPLDMTKLRLIEEVQKRPILYSTKGRFCIGDREKEWIDIGKILNLDVETCKKNWKSLRKGYIGFTTRGKKQVKKWPYADYLTFLNDYRNPATGASTQEYNNIPVDVIKLQLIEEIKKRPVIYIKSHMECDKRNIEWELLSIAMNVDVDKCKALWLRLRDGYLKRKSDNAVGAEQSTKYDSLLTFLDNVPNKTSNDEIQNGDNRTEQNMDFLELALFYKKLIKQVQNYEVIYSMMKNNYEEINNAWKSIDEVLNVSVETCQKKWNNLKRAHELCKAEKRNWMFMNDMKFLKKYISPPSYIKLRSYDSAKNTEFIDVHALKEPFSTVQEISMDLDDASDNNIDDAVYSPNKNVDVENMEDNKIVDDDNVAAVNESLKIAKEIPIKTDNAQSSSRSTTIITKQPPASTTTQTTKSNIDVFLDFLQDDIIQSNISFEQTLELKCSLCTLVYTKLAMFKKDQSSN